ncbi:unnamed protein product [Pleuronectes platessa]|uniref:Uncharacterized protein n=1 Tax=Pleuronectes platessa TaxID=8262 RepID=A0A9N7U1X8_PLEPL|nr:unnamed protein product [Pleuronectes platessa]
MSVGIGLTASDLGSFPQAILRISTPSHWSTNPQLSEHLEYSRSTASLQWQQRYVRELNNPRSAPPGGDRASQQEPGGAAVHPSPAREAHASSQKLQSHNMQNHYGRVAGVADHLPVPPELLPVP